MAGKPSVKLGSTPACLLSGVEVRLSRVSDGVPSMIESSRVLYAREAGLDVAEFRRVLVESGLGAIRPVDDEARLRMMLSAANLIVTARLDEPGNSLVGVARCVTDFSWCCYLSELAVCASAQNLGIGKGLLDEARRQLGPSVSLILASVPDAVGFYERAGMAKLPDAFWYKREY
ncbi:GNAT family N-acetyltransferase [Luteimonas panaciterrae]|uniref:GNAT family N-acetyltransferase n=1 Tax=Luteimonas panaciterrae TaxID=363885 RepID=UPI001CF9863F|nr:GNAT family N-acetyltransferase [Luteimonas panaciterrae]